MIFAVCKVKFLKDTALGSFDGQLDRYQGEGTLSAGALSDLAAHKFSIDGIDCALLAEPERRHEAEQAVFCSLDGAEARGRGQRCDWKTAGTVWWRGPGIDRLSGQYPDAARRAYDALFA
jgi:hypothetical protein